MIGQPPTNHDTVPGRDSNLPPTRLPKDGPGGEIARHVLPWWVVKCFPARVERAEQSPMFRALMRSAAKHRKSPGSLVRRRAWVRKGMYHEMIRDLREMGYSASEIFRDIELASSVPRWRVLKAFRPWDPQEILMKVFFTLFLVLVILWLLAEPTLFPQPPHHPPRAPLYTSDIMLHRLNAVAYDIMSVGEVPWGTLIVACMLLTSWGTGLFLYHEMVKWHMLRGQLWMLRLPIMTREYAIAALLTPLALVPIGGLMLGWLGEDFAELIFSPLVGWIEFVSHLWRTNRQVYHTATILIPMITATAGVLFANIVVWLMPFRLLLRWLVIRLLGMAMERERIAEGD
jgi:hypothetical protein